MANASLGCLNELHGSLWEETRKATKAQRAVQEDCRKKVARMFDRMQEVIQPESCRAALERVTRLDSVSDERTEHTFDPSRIAHLGISGGVDPETILPTTVANQLHADNIFQDVQPGLSVFGGISRGARGGYINLVARDLRAGKLRLRSKVEAGGTVFTVPKSSGAEDREVWRGTCATRSAA